MYTINNAKEQIAVIRKIFEKDLCTFYGGLTSIDPESSHKQFTYSTEQSAGPSGIPYSKSNNLENDYTQAKLDELKREMKDMKRETRIETTELKQNVRDLERENRYLRRSSWYDPWFFWNPYPMQTNTVVVVKDKTKDEKDKKSENDTEMSTADKLIFAATASAIVIETVYTVVKDDRIQLYLSGIDTEVERLRVMINNFVIETDSVSQIMFKSRCENFLNMYMTWRNKFAERVNSMFYTKIGTGTIFLTGLVGFSFSMPLVLTTAAVSSPFLAAYGTWHYLTSDKKKEPEKDKFVHLFTNLRDLDECQVLGSYPNLGQMRSNETHKSNYPDFTYSPSAPIFDN